MSIWDMRQRTKKEIYMVDILKHPILKQCYELCIELEKLPAGEKQTSASLKASDLLIALDEAIDEAKKQP